MSKNTTIYHPCEILTLKLFTSLNTKRDHNCFPTATRFYTVSAAFLSFLSFILLLFKAVTCWSVHEKKVSCWVSNPDSHGTCTCVFPLWSNGEHPAAGESHFDALFFTLFTLFFTLNHQALSSMQTLPHLLSFVLLLSFHHPAPVFLSQSQSQLKKPQTQAELMWIWSEEISAALWTWPASPRLGVILSRDLLPTRPCWIPAICFTALAFKCLIEPLISWTVATCVCVCDSWRRLRVGGGGGLHAWNMMG